MSLKFYNGVYKFQVISINTHIHEFSLFLDLGIYVIIDTRTVSIMVLLAFKHVILSFKNISVKLSESRILVK